MTSPTAADEERIALFLDYENLAIGARDKLGGLRFDMKPLAEALAERGRVVVRKAYADWSMFSEDRRMLTRNHVELIEIPQRMGMVRKNSADIKMAVDAMELCFERDYLTTFVICTGDSDFTPLVHKLRELNKRVIGVGVKASTSALLPPACDEFIFYEMLDGVEIPRASERAERHEHAERADRTVRGQSRARRPSTAKPAPEPVEPVEEAPVATEKESGSLEGLTALVTQTLAGLQRNSGDAVRGSALKRALIRKDPTFNEANFGFRSLGEMLRFLAERKAVELTESGARGDPEVGFPERGGGDVEMFAALRAQVVIQAQKGPPLMSGLKHQLKKRVPSFDERKLGYSGFLQFCKAAHTRGFVDLSWSDEADDYVLRAAESQGALMDESATLHQDIILGIGSDPERLELAYQEALKAGEGDAFAAALLAAHAAAPDDLLYSAWRYRLAQGLAQAVAQTKQRVIAWSWAVPLALVNALLLWLLSDQRIEIRIDDRSFGPGIVLLAAPISALAVLAFLVAAGPRRGRRALLTAAGIAAVTGYAWLLHPRVTPRAFEEQVLALMGMHVPVLAWSAVGLYLLWSARDAANRFAFLIKSLELFIAGGLFGIACGLFVGISMGMFAAIAIEPPEIVIRLFVAGGGGLVPVLAAAICYDPRHLPARQSFEEGLSRFIATLMRVLLPLTLVVLAVYVVLIPLHFRAAFENRDVLIIYNGMLFAVLALLVGATPVPDAEPTGRTKVWLRRLMVAIALLALVVGAYALAAIVYRTTKDVLTPNRVTFIGWNLVNLGVLLTLLVKQARVRGGDALASLRETFALAMVPYAAWALCVVLVLPWLFDTPPKGIEGLPPSIQDMVLAEPGPILLKCGESPHIYLLEDGRKRWVKDIPTFETQGYTWDDVREYVTCDEIDDIPDGPPIPEDAGRPPLLARPTVTAGAAKFDAFIAHL